MRGRVVLAVVCFAADASAAGFALDVHSARATSMATAMTGHVRDPSAIFYNPAGIVQGQGLDTQLGVTLIAPSFSYTSRSGEKTSSNFRVLPPVHAYVTYGITEKLSVGVGVYTPFGVTLGWPDGWVGRRQISSIALQTFDINPTAAYRIGPVSIGAGLQVVRGTVRLKRQLAFGENEGSTDLGGGTWGVGANVGVMVEPIADVLSLGIHYRSAVKLSFNGLADFEGVPAPLQQQIYDQAVKTSILTPDTLAMGVAVRPVKTLLLAADVVWYGWSNFKSVDLVFPDDVGGSLDNSKPKAWKNVANYHLGAEGEIKEWRVRGGLLYDPTPSPDNTVTPDSPDATRVNVAVGGGYVHRSGFTVDLAYRLVVLLSRESTVPELPGTYSGLANLFGVTLGYRRR